MKTISGTLFLTLFINLLHAQNPLVRQWDSRFGGSKEDYIYCLQQTSDGGYILGGKSISNSSGDKTDDSWGSNDYWIVKVDSCWAAGNGTKTLEEQETTFSFPYSKLKMADIYWVDLPVQASAEINRRLRMADMIIGL